MMELFFTVEGSFALYHPNRENKGQLYKNEQPPIVMARHAVFGDYQLPFDLYPKVDFCPYVPSKSTNRLILKELGQDASVDEFRVMCLSKEDFLDLCDFYPLTAESLKIQSLKKRKMFLDCMKMKEFASMAGY